MNPKGEMPAIMWCEDCCAKNGVPIDSEIIKITNIIKTGECMSEFKKYRRTNIAEMRPYIKGEDLSIISVSKEDDPNNDMGMVARNPKNHKDQWYVARKYFEDNFEQID